MADELAPVLDSLLIPTSIDLSAGPATLTVTATATDDLSGVDDVQIWFDRAFAYSYSPGSSVTSSTNLILMSGSSDSWIDGMSMETRGILDSNPSGTYEVTRVVVTDVQGNTRTYSPAELAAIGVNTSVEFSGSTPDTAAPSLVSLDIPAFIDLSAGPATLSVAATATDDLSGVDDVQIWFDRAFAYSYSPGSGVTSSTNLILMSGSSDSWIDGMSMETRGILDSNPSGTYEVARVVVTDVQGNTRTYSPAELAAIGVNTSVEFLSTETRTGTMFDDVIVGNDVSSVIYGLAGHDRLYGGGGDDAIFGQSGTDLLDGGTGSDRLDGGAGDDIYFVDSAGDRVIERVRGGIDHVYSNVSFALGSEVEILTLIGRNALSGVGNELANGLYGSEVANVLRGLGGNDVIFGAGSRDVLDGGNGHDLLNGGVDADLLVGANGRDHLVGGEGNDTLQGGAGRDVLLGGSGRDRIAGSTGNDLIAGGGNGDIFVFGANGGRDTVLDFDDGFDRIDLRAFGFRGPGTVLALAEQHGSAVVLDLGFGTEIVLQNMHLSDLGRADFFF